MEWLSVIPVAALASLATTLAIRFLDRPRAALEVEMKLVLGDGNLSGWPDRTYIPLDVTNVGDGDALDLQMFGHLCDVAVPAPKLHSGDAGGWTNAVPVLRSGEAIRVTLAVVGRTEEARRELLEKAKVLFTWTSGDRSLLGLRLLPRRRVLRRVRDLPLETIWGPGVVTVAPLPRRPRTLRRLRKTSPRARLAREPE